ncbi:TonB-dependent receptor [Oceanibaculum indicum]|uniref:TonB-dependent receptor-like protein n=1 Tax=Oceanibaculum indicum TaxID=526216 RepID=A0A420WBJ5_9PROT|nr:TonB-dependent receptor [Oceanibaculum indicum]RKQ68302.1 TonB-dependent receptor-like protein [Oceanibaculum indicum]
MKRMVTAAGKAAFLACLAGTAAAETYNLEPVVVESGTIHSSQSVRQSVESAGESTRSNSYVDGSVIQNLNPVNTGDALRYSTLGIINPPGTGDRFGGGSKIRTSGDWGASRSIDGLPAFKAADQEGGGYTNTTIPSIAIESIGVLRGGRAVGYGDGTDGGVLETRIKSGRGYKDHAAVSLDLSSAMEANTQAEVAHGTEKWDYYVAGSWLQAAYDGDPENLDAQHVRGGLGKFGYNFSEDTRVELLGIMNRSEPDIIRSGNEEAIRSSSNVLALTADHRLSDTQSLRAGLFHNDSHTLWAARSRDREINNNILFTDHYLDVPLSDRVQYLGTVGGELKRTEYLRDNQWDANFTDVALKSINTLRFDDNLTVTAGVRHTWFENDVKLNGVEQADTLAEDRIWSYELGAAYSVLPDTRVRASVATGYNRFFEKYGNFGSDALNSVGAGDEIVESLTYEIGVRQDFSFGHLDVALFDTEQDGVPRRNAGAIESMTVDQQGLEVEALWRASKKLTFTANYFQILDMKATRADGSDANGNIFFGTNGVSLPDYQLSVQATYAVTDQVTLWGLAYNTGGYEAENLDGTITEREGFTKLDIGGSWKVQPNWALRARVENVFDERTFGSTIVGTTANDGGNLGTVFWIGTDYTF